MMTAESRTPLHCLSSGAERPSQNGETLPPALAMARSGTLIATVELRPYQGREDKTKALLVEAFRLIGATGADAVAYVDDATAPTCAQ